MWRLTNNREIYIDRMKKERKKTLTTKRTWYSIEIPPRKQKWPSSSVHTYGKGGTVEYVIRSAKVIRENGHSR